MSESEKRLLLTNIKILKEKTGLSFHMCKQALDRSENEIDRAILFLI